MFIVKKSRVGAVQWVVVNQGSQWQLALHFFGQMDLVRLSPDSISYNAATGLQIGAQFQQRLGWLFGYPWNGDIHQICQSEWLLNDIISENCEIGMLWNKCYWYWFSCSRLTLFQDFPPVPGWLLVSFVTVWPLLFWGTFGGELFGSRGWWGELPLKIEDSKCFFRPKSPPERLN